MNATVCLVTPQIRNLSAYEAIILDLNVLDGANHSWLVGRETRFGGMTLGMVPHVGTSMQTTAGKITELNGLTYWGIAKLGKGTYPTTASLAGYNPVTKILNLSGGTTGMVMPLVYNTDYWGGDAGQQRVYTKSVPSFQVDIDPVDHWDVQIGPGAPPRLTATNYWVKVTAHNASTPAYPGGTIPMVLGGQAALTAVGVANLVNETVRISTANNAGTTYPTGQAPPATGNGSSIMVTSTSWTLVRFGSVSTTTYLNATGQWFNWTVGGGSLTQASKGSVGPFTVNIVPEFATILIPIVGIMAMFFVFRGRKKKREN